MTDTEVLRLDRGADIPMPETAAEERHNPSLRQRLGRLAARAAIVAPLMAAGATEAVVMAPPAQVPVDIGGAHIDVQLNIGSNVDNIDLQAVNFKRPTRLKALNKDIGANIVFNFNKVSLTNSAGQLDTDKAQRLLADFSNLKPEQKEVVWAAEKHYILYGAAGALAVGITAAGLFAWRDLRRKQLANYNPEELLIVEADRRRPRQVSRAAVGLAASGLVLSAGTVWLSPNHSQTIKADPQLNGTVLAGVGVSGPAKFVIDTLIPQYNDFIAEKNQFYKAEETSFWANFQNLYGTSHLPKPAGIKRIIFADDFQGEDGPAAIVGDTARAYGADLIVVGGDVSATGMAWETPVLDNLKDHAHGVPVFMNLGPHDSPAIANLARQRGFTVADGKLHTINGLPVLGANDPYEIPFGRAPRLINPAVTNQILAEQLITASCSDKPTPIITVHDNTIGTPVAEESCSPLVLTGRQYMPQGPFNHADSTEFISGSTGGHGPGDGPEAFGVIHNPAWVTEIDIDTSTDQVVSYIQIEMAPTPQTDVSFGPTVVVRQTSPPASPSSEMATKN